jgi:hypothetical protein
MATQPRRLMIAAEVFHRPADYGGTRLSLIPALVFRVSGFS